MNVTSKRNYNLFQFDQNQTYSRHADDEDDLEIQKKTHNSQSEQTNSTQN